MVQPRKHVSAPVAVWFYTDSDSPSIRKEAEARCETIFTHFMLGCDVRGFVELDSRDQARTIQGNYIALRPRWTKALEDRLGRGLTWVRLQIRPPNVETRPSRLGFLFSQGRFCGALRHPGRDRAGFRVH